MKKEGIPSPTVGITQTILCKDEDSFIVLDWFFHAWPLPCSAVVVIDSCSATIPRKSCPQILDKSVYICVVSIRHPNNKHFMTVDNIIQKPCHVIHYLSEYEIL